MKTLATLNSRPRPGRLLHHLLLLLALLALAPAAAQTITVSTLAGTGVSGAADGPGASATFNLPWGAAVDGAGNVYVADLNTNKVRKITADGVVSTLAGTGTQGAADGPGASATFYRPRGVAVDGAGNLYVTEQDGNKVRKITADGVVSTLAGTGARGAVDGPGASATFNTPQGVAVDGAGNVYVADYYANKVRKITAAGVVSTLAGTGTQGAADGPASSATFYNPADVAVDGDGNVYVVDYSNNNVRKITAAGMVSTLAGTGTRGATDGPGASATFYHQRGVAVDGAGNLYIVDTGNHKMRKITVTAPAPTLTSLSPSSGLAGSTLAAAGTNLQKASAVTFTSSAGTATAAPAGYVVASDGTGVTGIGVPTGLGPGDYTVTVTTSGGTSNGLTFTVTCAVVAQAQNVSLTLGADGTARLAANAVDNGSSATCGPVTLRVTPAGFSCANLGANQVTLTVTAPDGTTATATATVTVSVPAGLASTTWTGTASADASDCRNWSYGQLPTVSISAVVPVGTPNAPALPAGTFATMGLSVASGASLRTDAGTTLQVSGNLSLDGTTTFAGPVQLVGTANQTLGGQTAPGFSTLTLAKPAGTTVQLQRDLPIGASLTLSGGTLATASYAVQLGTSGTLSETDASYVLGNVAATRTLVPGTAENFGGLGLTLTPAAGSVAPGRTPVVRTTGTVLTGVGSSQSIKRYFDIQPATDQGLNVAMDFGYFAHELNNIAATNLVVFKSATTAGPWLNRGQSGRTSNATTASGTVSLAGISSFSIWTLGDAQNPLPVTLTSFTATAGSSGTVRLAWATASEVNSARFEVERSADGVVFAKVGSLAAAGTSGQAHAYALTDANLPAGASQLYYRLRQVDADGAAHYSVVRAVALGGAGLVLYPNPTQDGQQSTLGGAAPGQLVQVLDAVGRLVLTATTDASGAAGLVLPAGLPSGVYVVRVGAQALRLAVE